MTKLSELLKTFTKYQLGVKLQALEKENETISTLNKTASDRHKKELEEKDNIIAAMEIAGKGKINQEKKIAEQYESQLQKLEEFSQHKANCNAHWINTGSSSNPKKDIKCTCGLNELLKQ